MRVCRKRWRSWALLRAGRRDPMPPAYWNRTWRQACGVGTGSAMSSLAEAVSARRQNMKLQQRQKHTGGPVAARFSATRTAHCMAQTVKERWAASLTRGLSNDWGAVAFLERSSRSFLPVASSGYTIYVASFL